jgi:hypothetical protein
MDTVVTLQLETLRCISQFDHLGDSSSEPYLWVAFFFLDQATVTDSDPNLVATVNTLEGLSCRGILPENIRAGAVINIPPQLGRTQFALNLAASPSPVAGVIAVLIEENETSDNLIRIGHQVFGAAIRDELNKIVLSGSADLTDEQKKAIADRVKGRVLDAIAANAGGLEFFREKDRFLGFAVEIFDGPVLQLLRDQAEGLPYPIQDRIRSERTIALPPPFPAFAVVDEYEIGGSIRVSRFQPPKPDPCQVEADALTAAIRAIEETDGDLVDLQQQLRLAPPAKKQEIRNRIRQLQGLRRTLVAQRDEAVEALSECRSHHTVVRFLEEAV